jgi:hypothetical protein
VFQSSSTAVYVIDQELPIPEGLHLTGYGATSELLSGGEALGTMPTIQQASGTNLVCIAASASFLAGLYGPGSPGKYPKFDKMYNNGISSQLVDSAIEVDHLAFDGQNGGTGSGNTVGHGLVLFAFGAKVHDCYFLNIANTAIYVVDIDYLGFGGLRKRQNECRVEDNLVVNPGWNGIFVGNDPGSFGGSTDGHILNNIVVSPSQQQRSSGPIINPETNLSYEALHMSNAAGWWVVNNQFVGCPGDGAYFNTTAGLHLIDNTLNGFGCYPKVRHNYVGFNITTAGQTKLHPGRIIGNVVAAYEAANPFAPDVTATSTNTFEYFRITMETNVGRQPQSSYQAYVTEEGNVAHQASQFPPPIAGAIIPTPDQVTVPHGSATGVEPGMIITDSLGLIKKGTTVQSVELGSGSNPDIIFLSTDATPGSGDTVNFVGPTSVAWTYINELPSSTVQVCRTNEVVTGTINPNPVTTSGVTVIDPADYVGGEYLNPGLPPAEGEIIVATSTPGVAKWQADPTEGMLNLTAGGALTGAYPSPRFSPETVTTITSSGSYAVPGWATRLRITCVGGGGGGGGGMGGEPGQVGGAGGAAGATAERVVDVAGVKLIRVEVGGGGAGGQGGNGRRPPGDGAGGGTTRVEGDTISVRAVGGAGGLGALTGSTPMAGAAYGAQQGATSTVTLAASGGSSGSPGGSPFAFSPGGGGGGGGATGGRGGDGGGAGSVEAGGNAGADGGNSEATGGDGGSATSPGAPGGGGGAGGGATGGSGGDGAGGFVVVQAIG